MAKVLRKTRHQDWLNPVGYSDLGDVLGLFIPSGKGYSQRLDKMRLAVYPLVATFLLYGIFAGAAIGVTQDEIHSHEILVKYISYSLTELGNVDI